MNSKPGIRWGLLTIGMALTALFVWRFTMDWKPRDERQGFETLAYAPGLFPAAIISLYWAVTHPWDLKVVERGEQPV